MIIEGSAPSWRQLRLALRELGAIPVRVRGSHETWRFDDGETFIVVINHLGASVPLGIRLKFRRLRDRRSAREGEEPALLGLAGSW
jgi:predicted RNA binding protein YcfA (HicA-like mRNA interferase family)